MAESAISYSVFTKPWHMPVAELGAFVRECGFDGIELPIRPGYQVEPENMERDLPVAARQLEAHGVRIFSVAGPEEERLVALCGGLGIPMIRVMAAIPEGMGYMEGVDAARGRYEALLPALEKHDVCLGVQNHCGRYVNNAIGLRHCLEGFDPRYVGAVWDGAHEALCGGPPDLALDAIQPHLRMVNLKNFVWQGVEGESGGDRRWETYWLTGREGITCWPEVIAALQKRDWRGVLCLTAEYTDLDNAAVYIREDLAYLKSLISA